MHEDKRRVTDAEEVRTAGRAAAAHATGTMRPSQKCRCARVSRRSTGAANAAPVDASDEALEGSQPGDVIAGEMPSPEARKPAQKQQLPAGIRHRARSAAAALFQRARGRASGTSSPPASMSGDVDTARFPSAAQRPRSASQPSDMPGQATASMMPDMKSCSGGSTEARSDADPAAKRRRTDGEAWDKDAGKKPPAANGAHPSAAVRLTSADRTASDASAFSSQEPDQGGLVSVRDGSSLGSRRHGGAAGARPKGGGANGRRRLSSEGSAAAPITSLIEVCQGAARDSVAHLSCLLGMTSRPCRYAGVASCDSCNPPAACPSSLAPLTFAT